MSSVPAHRWRPLLAALVAALIAASCSGRSHDADPAREPATFAVEPLLAPCLRASEIPCLAEGAVQRVELAGTDVALVYSSGLTADTGSWGGWRLDVQRSLDVEADHLIDAEGRRFAVDAVPRRHANVDSLLVAREDAQTVDEFDLSGRLLATRDALTGGARIALAYDDGGRLERVDPSTGSAIDLRYDGSAHLARIQAGGISTNVATDADGRIVGLVARDGVRWVFGYNDGRLVRASGPTGSTTTFAYDDAGALMSVGEPTGRTLLYNREHEGAQRTLTIRSSSGAAWSINQRSSDGETTSRFDEPGAGATVEVTTTSHRRVERADGSVVEVDLAPDPRFGASAPIRAKERRTLPSGTKLVSGATRRASLSDRADPLSVDHLDATATGLDELTWSYDGATRVITETSAEGRVSTWTLDEVGRVVGATTPNGPAMFATYDTAGRGVAVERGDATWTRTFDPAAGSTTVDGPSNASKTTFDEAGRVVSFAAGDEAATTRTYDPAGDLIEVRPGGAGRHVLVRDGAGRISATAVPAAPGSPVIDESFERDADGNIVKIVRGGSEEITLGRGPTGAVDAIDAARVSIAAPRDDAGFPERLDVDGGATVEFERDGDRLLSERWSGPVDGEVSYRYDDRGRVSSLGVGGISTPMERDENGALIGVGPVRRELDPATGLVRASTFGAVTVKVDYDEDGQATAVDVTGPGGSLARRQFTRDEAGRVVDLTETVGATTSTMGYGYDSAGRLATSSGGATTEVGADGYFATVEGEPATTDPAGRLTALGPTTFTYDTAGRVASMTDVHGVTAYEWDGLGRLAGVRLPDGRHITYTIDGDGRRIARDVDGERTNGWLYAGSLLPVAELDATDAVRSVLLHDDDENLVGIIRDGEGLAVVSDQVGSPWLVVDADGTIVDHIVRDAGGRVVSETTPETITIGFAGGIADPLTGLVHFGAREYSPRLHRWLSPDPIGFASSDPNLYRYSDGDPVNRRDRTGLDSIGGSPNPDIKSRGDAGRILDQIDQAGTGGGQGGAPSIPSPAAPPGGPVKSSGGSGSGTVNGTPGGSRDPHFDPTDSRLGRYGDVQRPESGDTRDAPDSGDAAAGANGDTHLFTLTRRMYDLQLTGEYVAARDSEPGFEVQIRQVPVTGSTTVATVGAVALDVDGAHVVIHAREHDPLLVDGVRTTVASDGVDLPGGGTIRRTAGRWRVDWTDGSRVDVLGDRRLNVQIRPSAARVPRIDGLIGTSDGSLRTATRATVDTEPWPPSFETVHREFGPTWRITAEQSLFTYEPGDSTNGFYDPAFPSGPTDLTALDPATVAAARRLCAGLGDRGEPAVADACTLDVAATGDPSFATDAQLSGVTSPIATAAPSPDQADDDSAESSGKERAIADGETVTGSIDQTGAVARYVIDVPDGLGFALVDAEMSCDLTLAVEDDDGVALYGAPLCVGDLDHVRPSPAARLRAGRYHLTFRGEGDATGPFTFRYIAAKPTTFDVNLGDDIAPTPSMGMGILAEPGDVHLLRFAAQGAPAIALTGTAPDPSACGDIRVVVYDVATGTSVLRAPDPCDHTSRATLPDPNGTYVAVIDSPTWTTGTYSLGLDRGTG